ncbi:MAG: hypothetical protein LBI49_25800 [Nocardiopsaceae bacterium]|jgi:hypothetical protein|nr:hypothetical protein [Nocardiopsaceae bacterium]
MTDDTLGTFNVGQREPAAFRTLRDRAALEQVLTQLLGRKAWVAERTQQWGEPIPFQ